MATIEQLAEKLNKTVWVRGDLKRIYLNEGFNTKKMSTKTYIYEKDGDFHVSCNIECPSQPWQWIKSQQDEVKESVYQNIEFALKRIEAKLIDFKIIESDRQVDTLISYKDEEKWYKESEFYDFFGCYPEKLFTEIPKFPPLEPVAIESTDIKLKPEKSQKIKNSEVKEIGVNSKVTSPIFGIGIVISEDLDKIEIDFETAGKKYLMKKFAKLEKA